MYFKRTIDREIYFEGVGLHSGKFAKVTIKPAGPENGIIFIKKKSNTPIKAEWNNIVDTTLCTVVGNKKHKIATVEHLLSAIRGLRIDNLTIEVEGDEIPVLDGNAFSYVKLLKTAQFVNQNQYRNFIQIIKPISYSVDDKFIFLIPSNDFRITTRINFENETIGLQHIDYVDNVRGYINDISKAKTFGFLNDVSYLKRNGFALGGSLSNSIVIDEKGVINKNYLNYEDEFVRHKTLDIIGDLSLTGKHFLLAHVVAYKSGHTIHAKVLKKLFEDKNAFKIVDEPKQINTKYYRKKILSLLSA